MIHSNSYSAFMLDHASGTLENGLHLAAEIHQLMSCEGDEAGEIWEIVRKVILEEGSRDLHGCKDSSQIKVALEIIQTDYAGIIWRKGLSGVRYSNCAGTAGQLMHLEPGQHVFSHGHSALEATVVLDGELEDGLGTYGPGDIALAEPGVRHRPAAAGGKACTCYVARSKRRFWRFT